jgi:hypothetical protein
MDLVGVRIGASDGQVAIERNGEQFSADFRVNAGSMTVVYCCEKSGRLRGTIRPLGSTEDLEQLAESILAEIVSQVIEYQERERSLVEMPRCVVNSSAGRLRKP